MTDAHTTYLDALATLDRTLERADQASAERAGATRTRREAQEHAHRARVEQADTVLRQVSRTRTSLSEVAGRLPAPTRADLPATGDPLALAAQLADRAEASARTVRHDRDAVRREEQRLLERDAQERELAERERRQHEAAVQKAVAAAKAEDQLLSYAGIAGSVIGAISAAVIGSPAALVVVAVVAVAFWARASAVPNGLRARAARRSGQPFDATESEAFAGPASRAAAALAVAATSVGVAMGALVASDVVTALIAAALVVVALVFASSPVLRPSKEES